MGAFSDEVFEIVQKIPRGKVSTYGQVARLMGRPRSARYVGWALRGNAHPVTMPCHRVVFKDGRLAEGYAFGGEGVQRELLQSEGVVFLDEDHVDMDACLWKPQEDGPPHDSDGLPGRPTDVDWAREIGDA